MCSTEALANSSSLFVDYMPEHVHIQFSSVQSLSHFRLFVTT